MKSLLRIFILAILVTAIAAQYYKTKQEADTALRTVLQFSTDPISFDLTPTDQESTPGSKPLTVSAPAPPQLLAPPPVAGRPASRPASRPAAPKSEPLAPNDYGEYNGEITPIGIASKPGSAMAPIPVSAPDLEQLQKIQGQKRNQSEQLANRQGLQAQYSGQASSNRLNAGDLKSVQESIPDPPVPQYSVPASCGKLDYASAYAALDKLDQFYYYKKIVAQINYNDNEFYRFLSFPQNNITMFAPTNIAIQKTAYSLGYPDVYSFLTDDGATAVRAYIALYSVLQGQIDLSKEKYFSNNTIMVNQDPSNTTSAVKFQCGGGYVKYANITIQEGKDGFTIQDGLGVRPFDALNKGNVIQTCGALIYPVNQTLLPCDPYTACVTAMDQITNNFGNATQFLQFVGSNVGVLSLLQDPTWRGTIFIPQDSGVSQLLDNMQAKNLPTDQNDAEFINFQQEIVSFHIIEGGIIYLDPSNVANSTINQTSADPSIEPTKVKTTMANFTYCYTNDTDPAASTLGPVESSGTGDTQALAPAPAAQNPKTVPQLVITKPVGSATGEIFSGDDQQDKAQVLLTDLQTCNGVIQIINRFALPCKLPTVTSQSLNFGGAPGQGSGSSSAGSTSQFQGNSVSGIKINFYITGFAVLLLPMLLRLL